MNVAAQHCRQKRYNTSARIKMLHKNNNAAQQPKMLPKGLPNSCPKHNNCVKHNKTGNAAKNTVLPKELPKDLPQTRTCCPKPTKSAKNENAAQKVSKHLPKHTWLGNFSWELEMQH